MMYVHGVAISLGREQLRDNKMIEVYLRHQGRSKMYVRGHAMIRERRAGWGARMYVPRSTHISGGDSRYLDGNTATGCVCGGVPRRRRRALSECVV